MIYCTAKRAATRQRARPTRIARIATVLALSLHACRCSDAHDVSALPPTTQQDNRVVETAPISPSEAGVAAVDLETASIQLPRDALPVGAFLWLRAELVEADTVVVENLRAISIEAGEIRSKHVEKSQGIAVPKDVGMNLLSGHFVEGDSLDAHHVRARLVIATSVEAVTIRKLRGNIAWTNDHDAASVRNLCSPIGQHSGPAVCGRWR